MIIEQSNFELYEYKGVIHLHSSYSDGGANIEKIMQYAQRTDLDYVILTDHNSMQALREGYEGWHDNVLLLVGEEITPEKGNHYLALDIDEEIDGKQFTHPQHIINTVAENNGIGIIAHPFGSKTKLRKTGANSWKNWNATEYTGLEIWSYMIDWIDNVTPLTFGYYYFRPDKAIDGPEPQTLQKWDELAQKRHIVGIGSLDAHGKPTLLRLFKPLSYEYLFRTIRTHILTPAPLPLQSVHESKQLVYDAIRAGRCFIAYDFLADSMGFCFYGWMKEGVPLLMGDEVIFTNRDISPTELNPDGTVVHHHEQLNSCMNVNELNSVSFHASTPIFSELRMIHNGHVVKCVQGKRLEFETHQAGVYRVEVYYNNRPWIFSNPIFLR